MTQTFAFLHGGRQGAWVWRETVAAIEAQAGVGAVDFLMLDVPGCGSKRDRSTADVSFDAIVAELAQALETSGARDIVLVGHSQAGTVLPRLAETLPGRFRRLIYVTCSAPKPGQTIHQMMAAMQRNDPSPAIAEALAPDVPGVERFRHVFCNDMADADADAFLARLGKDMWPDSAYCENGWRYDVLEQVPSTYVLCLADAILPVKWQQRFAVRFLCDRIVSIDAGHQVMNTRPHGLAEILLTEAKLTDAAQRRTRE
jgi:pimeloyl-ACP methyl ester carboxylesterase